MFHPFTAIIGGATNSGKTYFLDRFLKNRNEMIENCPKKTLFCYGALNPKIVEMSREFENFTLYEGVPSEDELKNSRDENGNLLLILDDLMLNIDRDFLNNLFTKLSHNWQISVIMTAQHLFMKELRVPRQNSHYIIQIKSPGAYLQARNLGSQLFPGKQKFFMESVQDIFKTPFSYVFLDFHPKTPDDQRLKTYIYPNETSVVYVPIDKN
jgi:hypothetical protein